MTGLLTQIDVRIEWGLNFFADVRHHRLTRRTEVLVLETPDPLARVQEDVADLSASVPFCQDLATFGTKYRVRPRVQEGQLTFTGGALAAAELQEIVSWHRGRSIGDSSHVADADDDITPLLAVRFHGTIVALDDTGSGFVHCPMLRRDAEHTDIYVHHSQMASHSMGDKVSFRLAIRHGRKVQACDLQGTPAPPSLPSRRRANTRQRDTPALTTTATAQCVPSRRSCARADAADECLPVPAASQRMPTPHSQMSFGLDATPSPPLQWLRAVQARICRVSYLCFQQRQQQLLRLQSHRPGVKARWMLVYRALINRNLTRGEAPRNNVSISSARIPATQLSASLCPSHRPCSGQARPFCWRPYVASSARRAGPCGHR